MPSPDVPIPQADHAMPTSDTAPYRSRRLPEIEALDTYLADNPALSAIVCRHDGSSKLWKATDHVRLTDRSLPCLTKHVGRSMFRHRQRKEAVVTRTSQGSTWEDRVDAASADARDLVASLADGRAGVRSRAMADVEARVDGALAGDDVGVHRDLVTALTTALNALIADAPKPVVLALSDAPDAPGDVAAAFLLGQLHMAQRVAAHGIMRREMTAFAKARGRIPRGSDDLAVTPVAGP